jgi:hypothetical protein
MTRVNGTKSKISRIACCAVVFQAVFLLLHFAHDWWPNGFTTLFSGTSESVFQHMKIGFYSWLVASVFEWFVFAPNRLSDFAAIRLFGAVVMPLIFAGFWYLAAATVGEIDSALAEVLWANLVLVLASVLVLDLEDFADARPLPRRLKAAAFLLAAAGCLVYLRFAVGLPWVDLFEVPKV